MATSTEQHLIAKAAIIENKKILSPVALTLKDGRVTHITDNISSLDQSSAMRLDHMILLPGFVNAHCHLEFSGIGPLDSHHFVSWIKELMQKGFSAQASSIRLGVQKLIASGVTTVFDHISGTTPISDYRDAKLRIIGFGEVVGIDQKISSILYHKLKESRKISPIDFHISPHSIHSVDPGMLDVVFSSERKPFSIHLCESKDEQEYFQKSSGPMMDLIEERLPKNSHRKLHDASSAIQYIHKKKWTLNHSLIIHSNFISDEDMTIMREWKNICVVHCPGSFLFFNHGHFPHDKYTENRIPLALGTDSFASNSDLNYLHEIQLFLKKYQPNDIYELLPLLTTNACKAIGLNDIGQIKKGFHADLIGFKYESNENILEMLQTRKSVDFCMVGGNRMI